MRRKIRNLLIHKQMRRERFLSGVNLGEQRWLP
jgi:hypothetical protein